MATTLEFLAALDRAILVPTYQPRYSREDLLAFATEEQRSKIVPEILSLNQNYFLKKETLSIPPLTDVSQFPNRSTGRKIREIWWNRGYPAMLQDRYVLKLLNVADSILYDETASGDPQGIIVEADRFRFLPKPLNGGFVTFFYYQRPSALVLPEKTAVIQTAVSNVLTLSTLPQTFVTGAYIDITQARNGNEIIYKDLLIQNIIGNTIYLDLGGLSFTNVSLGDVASFANETSLIQLPDEAVDVLVQAVALRIIQGLNFPEQEKSTQMQYDTKLNAMQTVMTPRIDDQKPSLRGHLLGGFGRRSMQTGIRTN